MTRPNTTPMLDLSTGHLSPATRGWMNEATKAGHHGIMEREEGFFLSSHHAEYLDELSDDFPRDLLHCLRYAEANGTGYVLFDRDAPVQVGLPLYNESDRPCPDHNGYGPWELAWSTPGVWAVDPAAVPRDDLVVERTWTETLEDGPFEAPDGAWVRVGDASVRLFQQDGGDVTVTVFRAGEEAEGPIAHHEYEADDLATRAEFSDGP